MWAFEENKVVPNVVAEKFGGSGAPKEASGTGNHQSMNNEVVDEREKVLLVEDHDVLGGSEMHNNTGPSSRSTEE